MTHIPYQNPLDDAAQQPAPNWRWRSIIAWLIIAACVITIINVTQYRYRQTAASADQAPSETRVMQLTVVSKFYLGAKTLLESNPNGGQSLQSLQSMNGQLESVARAPTELIRLAIAEGEFQDEKAANGWLDKVAPLAGSGPVRQDIETLRTIYRNGPDAVPADWRDRLTERYAWFGHLALAHKVPADNPERKLVASQSIRTFYSLTIGIIVLGLALAGGLVLLVIALVFMADGKVKFAYNPPRFRAITFLEGFTIYLGGYLLISLVARWLLPALVQNSNLVYLVMLIPPAVGAFWPLWCGAPRNYWREGLGWHTGRGLFREIALGWVGYLAGFPIIAVGFWLATTLTSHMHAQPTHPILKELTGSRSELVMVFLLACVYAPLVEESMFRGALFEYLRSGHRWLLSAAVTSFIFAAIHPQGWTMIPALFGIAMVLAAIREWRGTIFASAAAHALNNGVVLLLAVMALR